MTISPDGSFADGDGQFDKFAGTIPTENSAAVDGKIAETQCNVDDLQDCVEEVKDFVIDVRDALGIFREVETDADRIGNILKSLEKIANVATGCRKPKTSLATFPIPSARSRTVRSRSSTPLPGSGRSKRTRVSLPTARQMR